MTPPEPRVAILGAGTIGIAVAHACRISGHHVTLIDRPTRDWSDVKQGIRRLERLSRFRGADTGTVGGIVLTSDIEAAAGAEFVVENVTEDLDTKESVYRELCRHAIRPRCVAANTSAILIENLASLAPDPSSVVGIHFMNPVAAIGTVEVVRGPGSSDGAIAAALDLLRRMGKTAIVVNDAPGFVINRILMAMVNQAAQLLDEGVAGAYEVDQLFKGCLGHAMGPLRTADLIGIDTVIHTLEYLAAKRSERIFEPAAALTRLRDASHLGMKTGQGFYTYTLGRDL